MSERELAVTFRCVPLKDDVRPLRLLLREAVEQAGYRMTRGVIAVDSAMVDNMAHPPAPFHNSRGRPSSEHEGTVKLGKGRGTEA